MPPLFFYGRSGAPALVAMLTLAGLLLRLGAAHGDLWLDEIWSLQLVDERAPHLWDVFVSIHHDNNHALNSLWLRLVGTNAPTLLLRAPAILLGALAAPAAAKAMRGGGAAPVAAALFAFGYLFVHYGSEARGYAGMILALLLAVDAFNAIFENGGGRGGYARFAAAVGVGAFFHLTMVDAVAAFCIAAAARALAAPDRRAGLRVALWVCLAATAGAAPALACFAQGALAPDFRVGLMIPFSLAQISAGLGGAARAALGLPPLTDGATTLAAAAVAVAALFFCAPPRRWFYLAAIFVVPALHAAAALPSQQYPRFHLTAAVALALLVSEALGALLDAGGRRRLFAGAALAAMALGQAGLQLQFFAAGGRGDYAAALAYIGASADPHFGVEAPGVEILRTARYYQRRDRLSATQTTAEGWCAAPPAWLIVEAYAGRPAEVAPERLAGPAPCPAPYRLDRIYPASGLSGFSWSLYRRASRHALLP